MVLVGLTGEFDPVFYLFNKWAGVVLGLGWTGFSVWI